MATTAIDRPLLPLELVGGSSRRHGAGFVPERGLALNGTAASILKLCDGDRTVEGIVGELHREYLDRTDDDVRHEVSEFLEDLLKRGLLRVLG